MSKLARGMMNMCSVYFDSGMLVAKYLLGFIVLLIIFGATVLAQEAKL